MRKIFVFIALVSVLAACSDDEPQTVELPGNLQAGSQSANTGDILTINGSGFLVDETYVITFADNVQGKITEITADYIKVEIPADAVTGDIVLAYKGQSTVVGRIVIVTNLNLYAYRRNFSMPTADVNQIVKIDKKSGKEEVVATVDVGVASASGSYEHLFYDNTDKSVVGIVESTLVKASVQTGKTSKVPLKSGQGIDYQGLVMDDNGNLYLYKRNYADPNNYITQMVKIDKQTGREEFLANVETGEGHYYKYLVYDKSERTIIGIVENTLLKVSVQTGSTTTVNLKSGEGIDYQGLAIDDKGTLYAYERNYADESNYVTQIVKVDKQNGKEDHIAQITTSSGYYESLVFDNAQKSILGIVGNTILKVDVQTGQSSTINLQQTGGVDYQALLLGK